MLIEFTLKNYRSIRDAQSFSMVKAKGGELVADNTFGPTFRSPTESVLLLRSSAIYGANGAGKSNVIAGLRVMKSIVLNSAPHPADPNPLTPHPTAELSPLLALVPFRFDPKMAVQATEFEVIFISEGVRYQYGFTATLTRIVDEWLIAYPNGRPQRLFSRGFDEQRQRDEYKLSDLLLGQRSVWQNATPADGLFLSTAAQRNSEQFAPVFAWFNETLMLLGVDDLAVSPAYSPAISPALTASLCQQPETKAEVLQFLKAVDVDMADITSEAMPLLTIKTAVNGVDGRLLWFNFADESAGRQKLFGLAGPLLMALKLGRIMVVDDLDQCLHPKIVEFLVKLFHHNDSNPNNAQLIFTTHDTSILSQALFRRDQIWFCEQDQQRATQLYPLTVFSPRKDRENLAVGYLSGRYGAVPLLADHPE